MNKSDAELRYLEFNQASDFPGSREQVEIPYDGEKSLRVYGGDPNTMPFGAYNSIHPSGNSIQALGIYKNVLQIQTEKINGQMKRLFNIYRPTVHEFFLHCKTELNEKTYLFWVFNSCWGCPGTSNS